MVVRFAAVALLLLAPATAADIYPVIPPTGLEAARQGGEVVLTWDAAPGAVRYEVFRDGTSLGLTDATVFQDLQPPEMGALYWVTAFDTVGRESTPSAPALLQPAAGDCLIVSTSTWPHVFVHPEDCLNVQIIFKPE